MRVSRRLFVALAGLLVAILSCDVPPPDLGSEIVAARVANQRARRCQVDVAGALAFLEQRHTRIPNTQLPGVAETIVQESRRAGLSWKFVTALIHVESSGNTLARSHAGALGLMQLMPATGEAVARQIGVRWQGPKTLFDPVLNVRLGVAYLKRLLDRYGSVPVALAAYNWGPTRIAARIRSGKAIPTAYTEKVLTVASGHARRT